MHSKIDQSTISKKNVNEWTPLPSKRPLIMSCTKGGFFSESAMRFLDLQISEKIFPKAILSLKFKFPAKNSKQQIQISSSG